MFRELPTVLSIAILLAAVSAAPALTRIPRHHVVQPYRHTSVLPVVFGSDAHDNYGIQPSQRRLPGETPYLPWTQDPYYPRM
jgi:hypothetical protein